MRKTLTLAFEWLAALPSLRDGSVRVRKNTVMVLTHLILNDMIKIKGQISELALRLQDPEQRIADLAR
jgi:condensin complex subunit 1